MLNSIQDAVRPLLPSKRKTNATSGWVSFNAPCCVHNGESTDTRGRGGIIMNTDGSVSYHCFNCNFKASFLPGRHLSFKFRKLLSWLGADENTIKRLQIDALRLKDLVNPEVLVEHEYEEIKFKPRPLPEEAQTFQALSNFYTLNDDRDVPQNFHDAVIYAASRGIDLGKYELMWTPESAYNLDQRIIIPFTWKGETIGYTSRAFRDVVRPKYHSSYEHNYVFNVDQQSKEYKFVIVCEGPFDAMAVDGVAVLSNDCSETQADIIDSLGREVIVVPDYDRAGLRLIDRALEYGWSVSFPVWQDSAKDISEAVEKYGRLFVVASILKAKETNRLKIELFKKKLYNKV